MLLVYMCIVHFALCIVHFAFCIIRKVGIENKIQLDRALHTKTICSPILHDDHKWPLAQMTLIRKAAFATVVHTRQCPSNWFPAHEDDNEGEGHAGDDIDAYDCEMMVMMGMMVIMAMVVLGCTVILSPFQSFYTDSLVVYC